MNLIRRQRFNYTVKDIIGYIFKCFCLRRVNKFRHSPNNEHKRQYIFAKGEEKLLEELNVVTLLKSIR